MEGLQENLYSNFTKLYLKRGRALLGIAIIADSPTFQTTQGP